MVSVAKGPRFSATSTVTLALSSTNYSTVSQDFRTVLVAEIVLELIILSCISRAAFLKHACCMGAHVNPVCAEIHMSSTYPPTHALPPFLPRPSLHLLAQHSIPDPLLQLLLCLEDHSFLMMIQGLTPSESVRSALLLPSSSQRSCAYNLELLESLLTSCSVLEDFSATIWSLQRAS
jgi:hypothetical protein